MSRQEYERQKHQGGEKVASSNAAFIVLEDVTQFIIALCLLSFLLNNRKHLHHRHHTVDRRGQWCPGFVRCFPMLILRFMLFPYYWWTEKDEQEYRRYDCDPCHIHHFYHANHSDETVSQDDGKHEGLDLDMFQDLSSTWGWKQTRNDVIVKNKYHEEENNNYGSRWFFLKDYNILRNAIVFPVSDLGSTGGTFWLSKRILLFGIISQIWLQPQCSNSCWSFDLARTSTSDNICGSSMYRKFLILRKAVDNLLTIL